MVPTRPDPRRITKLKKKNATHYKYKKNMIHLCDIGIKKKVHKHIWHQGAIQHIEKLAPEKQTPALVEPGD